VSGFNVTVPPLFVLSSIVAVLVITEVLLDVVEPELTPGPLAELAAVAYGRKPPEYWHWPVLVAPCGHQKSK
jgi:hypothetical protein